MPLRIPPNCARCKNEFVRNSCDNPHPTAEGYICDDCYYEIMGTELDKHPLGGHLRHASDKTIKDQQVILDFLSGSGKDAYGRSLYETLSWTNEQLEQCHSQVQWVFPLHEESRHANVYPIITPEIVEAAKKLSVIAENLRLAKGRFENFLGLEPISESRQDLWCVDRNHNLLRVTRIIRSLRLFGLDDEAADFYEKVRESGCKRDISVTTLRYWLKAFRDDVWNTLLD